MYFTQKSGVSTRLPNPTKQKNYGSKTSLVILECTKLSLNADCGLETE